MTGNLFHLAHPRLRWLSRPKAQLFLRLSFVCLLAALFGFAFTQERMPTRKELGVILLATICAAAGLTILLRRLGFKAV